MQSHHWFAIVIALVAGYALARFYPQIGQAVGLP